jgi:hypothetical protein
MRNGKVLVVSGSGNVAGNTNFQAGVFDPVTGTVTTQRVNWAMFCNGMVATGLGHPAYCSAWNFILFLQSS